LTTRAAEEWIMTIDRRDFLGKAGRTALGAAVTAAGPSRWLPGHAQAFPAHDVNWLIYQAPGGSIDTTARVMQPFWRRTASRPSGYVLGAGGRVARTKLFTARRTAT